MPYASFCGRDEQPSRVIVLYLEPRRQLGKIGSVTLVMQSKDLQAFVAQLGDLSESQRQVIVAAKVTVKFGQVH